MAALGASAVTGRLEERPLRIADGTSRRYICPCLGRRITTLATSMAADFEGIREKLPYLKDLGVTCIYLNPVFESPSNHRYNTADYMRTDPVLGSEDDLKRLAYEAKGYGIRIMLDGGLLPYRRRQRVF